MSTQMQKDEQSKEKTFTHEQEKPKVDLSDIKAGPPIRVTYNGKPYNLDASMLDVNMDGISDRALIEAVAEYINKQVDGAVVLRDHQVTRLENGYILISPPAVYG